VQRAHVVAAIAGVLVGTAFVAGAVIGTPGSASSTAAQVDAPPTHDVSIRSAGGEPTPVTVEVYRHGAVIMEREVEATDTFEQVLRLQGGGEFTVVVSTATDETTVEVDRNEATRSCDGDVHLQFSVESDRIFLSTGHEPDQCS
jgi:hypothetical protein